MHVAPTGLQQGSGSWDLILVLGIDEQRKVQGSGRGMGMEEIHLEMIELKAGALDLSR